MNIVVTALAVVPLVWASVILAVMAAILIYLLIYNVYGLLLRLPDAARWAAWEIYKITKSIK